MARAPFDKALIIRKMLEQGIIDKATLNRVLFLARSRDIDVLQVLLNYSNMTPQQIQDFAAEQFNLPRLDLDDIVLNPKIANLVPLDLALAHRLIPAFKIINRTHVAVSNPFDIDGINSVMKFLGEKSDIFLVSEEQVVKTIRELHPE
jgi:type IV pilus assembly protein PilB